VNEVVEVVGGVGVGEDEDEGGEHFELLTNIDGFDQL
jgi:hypothetical protein